jgi:pimeloyl-ACP methyl ester carboxylesterase
MRTKSLHSVSTTLLALTLGAAVGCGKLPWKKGGDDDDGDGEGAEEPAAWTAAPCEFSFKQIPFDDDAPALEGVKEGANVRCGFVEVPETRDDPESRKIKIHFAEFFPEGGSAAAAPLVVHFGGPGETGQGVVMMGHDLAVGTGRNVLAIGQRGTWFSGRFVFDPVKCDSQVADQGPCNRDLEARYRLASYNTKESVADFVAVADALGHDKLVAYGVSYGTFFMSRLAKDYPDRVEALLLDSVMPFDGKEYLDGLEMATTYHEYHHALRESHARYCDGDQDDPDLPVGLCPRVDPKETTGEALWATGDAASKALRDFMGDPDTKASDYQFLDGELYNLTMYQVYTGLSLFETAGMVEGDYEERYATVDAYLIDRLGEEASLTNLLGKPTDLDARLFSVDLLGVVTCNESARLVDLDKMAKVLADDEVTGALPDEVVASRYACPTDFTWLDAPASDVFGDVPAGIRTLVVNSSHDAATPVSGAKRVAAQIGADALFVEVPCTGHGVLGQSGKEVEAVKRFVAGELTDAGETADWLCEELTAELALTGERAAPAAAPSKRRTTRPPMRGWTR